MRRIMAWCVAGLPFAPRSRRAIDETLADWAHEHHKAPTGARRMVASARGLVSLVRVVSIAVVRETTDLGWSRGLARRGAVVAAVATLFAVATALPTLGAFDVLMVPLGVPLALLVVMPPSIFLILAWRPPSRAVPTAGTACFLALVTFALAGWLVPFASDLLNGLLRDSLDGAPPASDMASHLSFGQIALAVTGWTALAGTSAICAAMVARRAPLVSRWWLVGVPAIYIALVPVFTFAIGTSFIVFRSVGDPPEGFRPGIAAWTTAAALMTVAMTYGRGAIAASDRARPTD